MYGRMNKAISIEKRVAGTSGRYVGRTDGVNGEAELNFIVRRPGLISPDHTEAPASMRGTGAAMALVEHMIGDARASSFKIVPVCPCVLAQYRKHPEWSNVITSADSAL
jgi:predicted GNAT family acetyltransferase